MDEYLLLSKPYTVLIRDKYGAGAWFWDIVVYQSPEDGILSGMVQYPLIIGS